MVIVRFILAAFAGVVGLAIEAPPAASLPGLPALPIGPAALGDAAVGQAGTGLVNPDIHLVHRCHRRCRVGRGRKRQFHRHVGPNCRRRLCNRRFRYRPPGWRRMGCIKFGDVWVCRER